jgi:hypothetical protein
VQVQFSRTHVSKTNVEMDFYYVNICKHEHEKNVTRLWCKIMLKIGVVNIEKMRGLILFIPLWGPSSKKLSKRLLCVH